MSGLRMGILSVLSIAFAAIIGLELSSGPGSESAGNVASPASPAQSPAPPNGESAAARTSESVATILARPLFDPHRRPQPGAADGAPAATGLPRLAGLIVGPSGRAAIFASDAGGKPTVVAEGARIGPYLVQSIQADEAVVRGPDGVLTLHPTFQSAPPDQPAGSPAPPARVRPRAAP